VKPAVEQEEPLRAEIRSFLHSVRTRTNPVVPLEDGRRALAVALEILSQIQAHSAKLKIGAPAV
jgi:predicted dehydrogenase